MILANNFFRKKILNMIGNSCSTGGRVCGSFSSVQDFSLAYSHSRIRTHQSLFSQETRTSLYGVCCRFHLDDLADEFINAMADGTVNENRRAELHEAFLEFKLPAIVNVTFFFISADHDTDNCMVQHANA